MSNTIRPVVSAHGLCKCFGDTTVVNGIDFNIYPGRCFGFLGPNGAGKTTTLRMILGISRATAGSLSVFDRSIPEMAREVRQKVGVVPQHDNLDPDFTVAENLQIYGSYFGLNKHILAKRIDYLLDFVGLNKRTNAPITTLSGGMKRRLTIARALINDPELIIMDEPTTGLDPQARHVIWTRLRDLIEIGKTLLLTTHYMEEAERLCDQVVIMDHGSILAQDSPQQLINDTVEKDVLEIRGDISVIENILNKNKSCHIEKTSDTIYCFSNVIEPLLEQIRTIENIIFLQRPTTLEDVFLRLTGRELRD